MAICPPAGKGAFHLVSCHCIFQKRVREWERKPVNMTKHHVNKTLKHYCSFIVTIPESKKVVYQWRHELPWSHTTHMFCSETPRLRNDILCGKDARADISDFKEHPKKITGSKILTKCAFTSSCSSHSGDWNAPLSERAALFRRHYGGRKLKWWMCLLISCTYKEKKCVRKLFALNGSPRALTQTVHRPVALIPPTLNWTLSFRILFPSCEIKVIRSVSRGPRLWRKCKYVPVVCVYLMKSGGESRGGEWRRSRGHICGANFLSWQLERGEKSSRRGEMLEGNEE